MRQPQFLRSNTFHWALLVAAVFAVFIIVPFGFIYWKTDDYLTARSDRVITAQQAGAYKPDRRLFDYAHEQLGVSLDEVVHICASPHLDHAAARDIGFRCVWIDRGTGRQRLPDYTPDATLATLDKVPPLFASLGW